jgi:hypothetical protein
VAEADKVPSGSVSLSWSAWAKGDACGWASAK